MVEASNGQEALQLVLEAAAAAGEFQITAVLSLSNAFAVCYCRF